jgi:hypothetical protein
MNRLLHTFAVLATAAAMLTLTGAAQASVLSTSVSPSGPGTAKAPKPQQLTFVVSSISETGNSHPTKALIGVTEKLPKAFADKLASFATCPASAFANLSATPPPCPVGSLLGTTAFTAYIPSLVTTVNTVAGYVYKTGANSATAWVHVTKPISFSLTFTGKLKSGSKTAGPTIYLNLSPAVDLGVTAYVSQFRTVWETNKSAGSTTKPKTASKQTKKPKPKPKPKTVKASLFESTTCSADYWDFAATLAYKGGASETISDPVQCATGGTPPPVTKPCLNLILICIPEALERN